MNKRVAALDGLRGIAILMVLLFHANYTFPNQRSLYVWIVNTFCDGMMGVEIFFVLSGYLITTILIREFDATDRICFKDFYIRRVLRIFPAFYFYFFFVVALAVMNVVHITPLNFLVAGLHLMNYVGLISLVLHTPVDPGPHAWFLGHFWTLSMEEQFYWLWPAVLLFLLRSRRYSLLAILVAAMPLIRMASYFVFPTLRGESTHMLHTGSDAILCGCLLAIGVARYPGLCQKLLMPSWGIAALVLYFYIGSPLLTKHLPSAFSPLLGFSLVVLTITVILANVLLQKEATWYHRLLENRVLVYIGRISYSVYLWQQLFMRENTTWMSTWPVSIVLGLAVGWLSYTFIEIPFLRLKDKFAAHTKKEPAAGASAVAA